MAICQILTVSLKDFIDIDTITLVKALSDIYPDEEVSKILNKEDLSKEKVSLEI